MFKLEDFKLDPQTKIFVSPDKEEIAYKDKSEEYLLEVLKSVSDLSSTSKELVRYIKDWPTKYHLSPKRANLLRGLDFLKHCKYKKILELGSGCGSITRWLGENFEEVDAVEGNLLRTIIAKERCRDLKNVRFFCANIQGINFEKEYDLVTLIGVLEYAPIFFLKDYNRKEACILMLKKAFSALKPKGLLIIAIENKLGLKYWAGCKEDHSGRLFDGIYNYPSGDTPVTFSKKELTSLLKMAGFKFIEYFYPFPDYKLCSTIVKDENDLEKYYVHNWLDFPFEDNIGREYLFHEGLVLRNIVHSGLFAEFANSFLVIASPQKIRPYRKPDWVIKKIVNYPNWSENFHYIVSLYKTKDGLKIKRQSICKQNHLKLNDLEFNLKEEADFVPGDLMIFSAWKAIFSNNPIHNFLNILCKLKDFLMCRFYIGKTDNEGYPLLKGEAIDCTLWNLIENEKGIFFIDKKWNWIKPISIDFVLFRSLLYFFNKTFPFLRLQKKEQGEWIIGFIKKLYPNYNIDRYKSNLEQEKRFQEQTYICSGISKTQHKSRPLMASIVIPVFNKLEYTKKCIEALYKITPVSLFELIVVNNASTDGTKQYLDQLSQKLNNIRIIDNSENLGFAKACNQGAKLAKGKYIVFLNNDTIPLAGWLEEMIKVIEEEERVGVVGSKLLYPDNTIQHAGVEVADDPLPISPFHIYCREPADYPEANVKRDYPAVTGACMLTPKWLFEELGGFDEGFLNGYEDVDYCFRVKERGYRIVYTPKSVLYHFESVSEGRFKAVKENEKRLLKKWAGKIKPTPVRKVSIVILNYNNWKDTIECLESIYKNLTYRRFQIVLIDNGSKKDNVIKLKQWLDKNKITSTESSFEEEVIFIENPENLGFAGGNNVGIKYALDNGADYIWLLNNDTVVDKNALESSLLISEMAKKEGKKIGIISSKIYCYNNRERVQYDGKDPNYRGKEDIKNDHPHAVDFAPACSLLICRELIQDIGLLNEDYFLYFEDNDFCQRAMRSGWMIFYNPYSKVYHKGGASIGEWLKNPISAYYATRNLLYCYGQDNISECFSFLENSYWKELKKTPECVKGFVEGIKDFIVDRKGKIEHKRLDLERWEDWPDDRLKNIAISFVNNPDKWKLLKFLSFAQTLLFKNYAKKGFNKKEAIFYYNKGEEMFNKGNTEEAIKLFRETLKLDPQFAHAYNNLAAIYWQKGDKEKALYYIIKAMEIAPDDPDIIWNSGQIMIGLGFIKDACEIYNHYIEKHPEYLEMRKLVEE